MAGIVAGISLCLFTGCLNDDDELTSEHTVSVPATLSPLSTGECAAWVDEGGKIMLTAESVQKVMSNRTLANTRRAVVYCRFDDKNKTTNPADGTTLVTKAELIMSMKIPVYPMYTPGKSEKDDEVIANATKPDSINQIFKVNDLYAYRGFVTIDYSAQCDPNIEPALTMVCDSIKENEVFVHMLFNTHGTTSSSNNNYLFSYDLQSIEVAGKDEVQFHFYGLIGNKKCQQDLKVSRQNFLTPDLK